MINPVNIDKVMTQGVGQYRCRPYTGVEIIVMAGNVLLIKSSQVTV